MVQSVSKTEQSDYLEVGGLNSEGTQSHFLGCWRCFIPWVAGYHVYVYVHTGPKGLKDLCIVLYALPSSVSVEKREEGGTSGSGGM